MINDPQLFTLSLRPSLIVEQVKADTFLKGKIEGSSAQGAEGRTFNVQAGDDEYHERKMQASVVQAAENVRTLLVNYASPVIGAEQERESVTLRCDFGEDILEFDFYASSRVRQVMPETMARILQRYITHRVLSDWFLPFNPEQAALYQSRSAEDMADFRRTFNRVPPTLPPLSYPRVIKAEKGVYRVGVGKLLHIRYEIFPLNCKNDVVPSVTRGCGRSCYNSQKKRIVTFSAEREGTVFLTLYSRHDDSVSQTIKIEVHDRLREQEDSTDESDGETDDEIGG